MVPEGFGAEAIRSDDDDVYRGGCGGVRGFFVFMAVASAEEERAKQEQGGMYVDFHADSTLWSIGEISVFSC